MTSHHVTVKWQQNYFYMFKMISTLYMLYSRLSLNEHLGETDTCSWPQPFSVTPFSWLCMLLEAATCCSKRNLERSYLTRSSTGICLQFQQVSRYVGCSLVATVGEARMRLFPNYYFRIQNTIGAQGVLSNNIYWSTREWQQSFEAGSCICHGQQKGTGQT